MKAALWMFLKPSRGKMLEQRQNEKMGNRLPTKVKWITQIPTSSPETLSLQHQPGSICLGHRFL